MEVDRQLLDNGRGGALDQHEPVLCSQRFAFEIWKIFLQYIHDADNKQLWKCREVSRDVKTLADEVLKEKATLWKTSFENDWPTFLKGIKGTRFTSIADVDKFLSDMEGYEGHNPFPNGVVILTPKVIPGAPVENMYGSFRNLLTNYSECIQSLVYTFNDNTTEFEEITQILSIFKLKKLRRLAIHKTKWVVLSTAGMELVRELSEVEDVNIGGGICSAPRNVTELQIFGTGGVSPCSLILFTLFPKVAESLKRLRVSLTSNGLIPKEYFVKTGTRRSVVEKLLLTNLKVEQPAVCYIELFLRKLSLLNEFSFVYPYYGREFSRRSPVGSRISTVFQEFDKLPASQNIELLQVCVDERLITLAEGNELEIHPPINEEVKYPKVNHLIINFSTVLLWKPLLKGVVEKLSTAIENLLYPGSFTRRTQRSPLSS